MMTDLKRLEDAFRKADALAQQGDKQAAQDAKAFADEIRRLAQAGGESRPSAMAQLNTGIANSVGGLADFLNPFDKPHALNPLPEGTGSAKTGIRNVMDAAGIETTDEQPEGFLESFARGSGEAAGALIPTVKGLQVLSKAGGAIGTFADDALLALRSLSGASGEVVAGGLSRGAEKKAEDAGAPDWVQGIASVAAPMAVPGGYALAKAATKISPVAALGRKVAADLAPYTSKGGREVASQRLQALAGGKQRADDLAGRITSDNPLDLSPAQQTGDPNMMAVENLAADQDAVLRETITTGKAHSADLASGQVADMGGDIEAGRKAFHAARKRFTASLQKRMDDALAASDERIRDFASINPESENGRKVVDAINDQLTGALAEEKRLWTAINRATPVVPARTKAAAAALVDETPYVQRNDVPRAVRDILEAEDIFGEDTTVKELYGAYSELRRVARSAMAGNDQNKNMARIANEVADAILEDLGAIDGVTSIGRQINEARAYSAALHEAFDRGAAGRLLKRTLDGDTAIDPELALRRTVGRGGAEGLVTSQQIDAAGGRAANEAVQDYLVGEFGASAVNSGTGEITLPGARRWMAKNKELLQRYPELKGEIDAAVSARESAEVLAGRISRRIAALEDAKRSAAAEFIGGRAEDAVKAVVTSKNPAQTATRLANEARRDKTGAALDGVKGAFSEYLIANTVSAGGMDAAKLQNMLADPRMTKALRAIFTDAEVSRLRLISQELAKAQSTKTGHIGNELSGARANRLIEYVGRIIAANQGAQLGNNGASLQTAQMASSRMKEFLGHLTRDKASQIIADAVTDPDLFKALLTGAMAPNVEKRAAPYFVPYLVGAGASGE